LATAAQPVCGGGTPLKPLENGQKTTKMRRKICSFGLNEDDIQPVFCSAVNDLRHGSGLKKRLSGWSKVQWRQIVRATMQTMAILSTVEEFVSIYSMMS
jgi:hypothetical protein